MDKRDVTVEVDHTANYQEPDQVDHWRWTGTGEWIQLRHTVRLSYTNEDAQHFQVRWSRSEESAMETPPQVVEVIQPHLKLRFNLANATYTQIRTPYGHMPVEVRTQAIHWQVDEGKHELKINYQLYSKEELFGRYCYRVKFH